MPLFQGVKPVIRWVIVLLGIATLGALVAASVPALRESLLRSAGWALVVDDPPVKADVIVVSADSGGAGILEAADLVGGGYAKRVAIFALPPTRADHELRRRGADPDDEMATAFKLLRQLSITDVALIRPVTGTEDEGKVLKQWCATNAIHSILFVSMPDHSRRTRRVLQRMLAPHGVTVTVRYARFAEFDPNWWWRSRGGERIEAVELEKLLLDVLAHPF
jgi:hypothetical protein